MTTIASDGVTVAADGLRCAGHEPIEYECEKLKLVDGVLYGFTGTFSMFEPFIEWHKKQASAADAPKAAADERGSLLVFRPDRVETYSVTAPFADPYPYPCAFGSGADFATAVLAFGGSPRQAVEVAIRKNVWTGGLITEFEIPAAKKLAEAAE